MEIKTLLEEVKMSLDKSSQIDVSGQPAKKTWRPNAFEMQNSERKPKGMIAFVRSKSQGPIRPISDSEGDSDSEYEDNTNFMISKLTSPVNDLTKVRVSTQKFDCKGIPIDDDSESGEEEELIETSPPEILHTPTTLSAENDTDSESGEEEELIETSPPEILHIPTALSAENEVATLSVSQLSILSPHPKTRAEVQKRKYVIPDPAIPWDDAMKVQENVQLQVEDASGEEYRSRVTESGAPISIEGHLTYSSWVQEQTPDERKWNQLNPVWSKYVHSEEMQHQYRTEMISVASILPCTDPNMNKDKVLRYIAWPGETDLCCETVFGMVLEKEFSERYDDIEYQPMRKKKVVQHRIMTELNDAIAVELLPFGMRRAPTEFRDLYHQECRVGISQLNKPDQTEIKRMLEILTGASVPQPPEDDQLSALDTEDASFQVDLGTPSDHQTIRYSLFIQGLRLETKLLHGQPAQEGNGC